MTNNILFNGKRVSPSKVVCVGRNYVAHIKELNNAIPTESVIFIKPNSAISSELLLPGSDEIHYEGELSFLLDGGELVGVGFGLDLTKRQIQNGLKNKGLPWERAKAFDGSAVFSDFVAITGAIEALNMELYINGQLQQKGGCTMMLNSPAELVKEISSFMTLEDGDILMTGTPAGVGQVHAGDEFAGRIFNADQLLIEARWLVIDPAR
ncbi:2-keto-4-pentenoate hydratase [hydrothermal vent metagenome]|uniref:2-keto-4-pentenoate hydratase n=1 Tax=hydrothermal vent metagenome TaxID=652676 RepID=A0A3B0VVB4_9ZZZZ